MSAEALTPMADLSARWGVTANTVSRRLSFLGIKPERQGNHRFITAEQLALGDELQQHILSGKPMESFPRADQSEGRLVARRVDAQVTPQVAALVAAITAAMPSPAADPLQRARALAEAADNGLVLDNEELRRLGVRGVAGKGEGAVEAHGYRFLRHKPGNAVLWTVERLLGRAAITSSASPATSRAVGFLADPSAAAALQTVSVSAVSLPRF